MNAFLIGWLLKQYVSATQDRTCGISGYFLGIPWFFWLGKILDVPEAQEGDLVIGTLYLLSLWFNFYYFIIFTWYRHADWFHW